MKKILIFIAVLAFNHQLLAQNGLIKGEKDYYLPNTIIVKLKQAPNADIKGNVLLSTQIKNALSPYNVSSAIQQFPSGSNALLKGTQELDKIVSIAYLSGEDPLLLSKKISRIKDVEWAEPRYVRIAAYDVNDPQFNQVAQYNLFAIKAKEAWDINKGNKNVIIGIIDTGVFWGHPDLEPNIHQNLNEDADHDGHTIEWDGSKWILDPGDLNGIDDDNNGCIDDLTGWDFGGDSGIPDNNPVEDAALHGTLVAGIAGAATNNGIGIASIGFNCSIMPVKCSRKDIDGKFIIYGIEGIKYAADNGAQIINCSYTGFSYSRAEQEVITYAISKGALVVAAAGNDNVALTAYPAGYEGVLSVAASNASDKMWYLSNYGGTIDVVAPGYNIYSTWGSSDYAYLSGTSFASPLTAGLAGLVKSQFPNYNPLQVAEQIRVTTDDIYSLNADSLKNKLGTGRINAYKALTGTGTISVRAMDVAFNDEGNNNGIIQSGELASIAVNFINYLSPVSNVQVTLSTESPYIAIQNSTFNTGSLSTLGSIKNGYNKYYFLVKNNTPENQKVDFLLTYSGNGYSDFQWISVVVNQTYNTMAENKFILSIANTGNIGFDDYPDNTQGMGFRYLGGDNLLYEGSFMYGTSGAKLVDNARVVNQTSKNKDFKSLTPFIKKTASQYADTEGFVSFNDDNAGSNKLGIETRLHAYTYKTSPFDSFIILRSVLKNNSGADINDLYAGWFLDLDLDATDFEDDVVAFDNTNQFIYAYDNNKTPFKYYVGAALLTGQNLGVFAIDNALSNGGISITPEFSKYAKWNVLSGGIGKTSAGPGDISLVISAGPVNIKAGSFQNISFVIAAGNSQEDLNSIITNSRIKYAGIPNDEGSDQPVIPDNYSMSQNFPNPFISYTKILYDLPKDDYVTIKVFDILGREIARLVDGTVKGGKHFALFNGNLYPSGVYLYRIETSSYSLARKMVLTK